MVKADTDARDNQKFLLLLRVEDKAQILDTWKISQNANNFLKFVGEKNNKNLGNHQDVGIKQFGSFAGHRFLQTQDSEKRCLMK